MSSEKKSTKRYLRKNLSGHKEGIVNKISKSHTKKEEMQQIAKILYLAPGDNDSSTHKYQLREIATKMQQDYNIKIDFSTISRWVKKEGWDDLWTQGQRHGIQRALIETPSNTQAIDEIYVNSISTKVANHLKLIDNITTKACRILDREFDRVEKYQIKNPNKKITLSNNLKILSDIIQHGTDTMTKKESEINAPTLIQINIEEKKE